MLEDIISPINSTPAASGRRNWKISEKKKLFSILLTVILGLMIILKNNNKKITKLQLAIAFKESQRLKLKDKSFLCINDNTRKEWRIKYSFSILQSWGWILQHQPRCSELHQLPDQSDRPQHQRCHRSGGWRLHSRLDCHPRRRSNCRSHHQQRQVQIRSLKLTLNFIIF